MAYKENWIVIAMTTTIKLVRASIFRFHMWSVWGQRVNDDCMHQTFPEYEKHNFKANYVIQLSLFLGYNWHINVTVKYLKMWNPKKK